MSKQITKVIQNFQEKITELSNQTLNPYSFNYVDDNKKVPLNRTIKSKSQHTIQKNCALTQSNQPSTNTDSFQRNSVQSNLLRENSMISQVTVTDKPSEKVIPTSDLKEINQLINQKKKEIVRKNKYYLCEISKIRQNLQLNSKIRNKLQEERKSTTSSQELYEKCWDETLKEINKDRKQNILGYEDLEIQTKKQSKAKQKPKPLRSQIFSKIREQEDKYFHKRSELLIKRMKQKSLELTEELTAQLESASIISKERQLQRSKEREEAKQEIVNQFKYNGQQKLVKLLQNKSSNRYQYLQQKYLDKSKNNEQNYQEQINSFSKRLKKRSSSQNCILPLIEKSDISTKQKEYNQILEKIAEKNNILPKNNLTRQINYFKQSQHKFSNVVQFD